MEDERPEFRHFLGAILLLSARPIVAEDLSKIPEIKSRDDFRWRPNIIYPYEAKRSGLTGAGIAIMDVDSLTGKIKAVRVARSTGSAILDQAILDAFRQARFKKGMPNRVQMPIRFTLAKRAP